ncbi:MAG: hypothetical protein HYU56_00150 [Candidatus Aenigmarchaeota archaeon]|nr:hypothetical protein [Candidatus Aenigmarchaeota archaeon]
MPEKKKFILEDSNFARDRITSEIKEGKIRDFKKQIGHVMILPPFEAYIRLDATGPPGFTSGMLYSLSFQVRKWEYNIVKADEWIEVNPVHAQYYQLTHRQKEELEGRIKSGLASTSQSVADLELLMHDERKYREFLHYFGYRTFREIAEEAKKKDDAESPDYDFIDVSEDPQKAKKHADEHSLKAVFIDQVDAHTGEGIAMRNIVARWPTLITDFMKMSDEDIDVNKVMKKMDVSKAEAVVLVTKNKLYQEWKRLFGVEIKSRYNRIKELVKSRKKSVEEYRNWLKPTIARHRMVQEGLASEGGRAGLSTAFIKHESQALALSEIVMWIWKDTGPATEFYKGGTEELAKLMAGVESGKSRLSPYDNWTKKNLIFHPEQGLVVKYPWITDEWVKKQLPTFYPPVNRWMFPHKPYYAFFIITMERANIRMPTGAELEDGTFDVNAVFLSQNALFVKLLELRAKQEEMNRYVDELIGTGPANVEGKALKFDDKNYIEPFKKFFEWFSLDFAFRKGGPYERDFEDRYTKYYAPGVMDKYRQITGFIKTKMGLGVA